MLVHPKHPICLRHYSFFLCVFFGGEIIAYSKFKWLGFSTSDYQHHCCNYRKGILGAKYLSQTQVDYSQTLFHLVLQRAIFFSLCHEARLDRSIPKSEGHI